MTNQPNNDKIGCVVLPSIRCYSGTYFNLLEPNAEDVKIEDIAQGLSNLCRYVGQCNFFFSVAAHSINCTFLAEREGKTKEQLRAIFLHDASEAYVGDMSRPMKLQMPRFKEIEKVIQKAIGQKFGIDFDEHREVINEYDNIMLMSERECLFSKDDKVWAGQDQIRTVDLNNGRFLLCETPFNTKQYFMNHYREYFE